MSHETKAPPGPDLTAGASFDDFSDQGTLLGHVGDDAVLVVRQGERLFAIGAICTHYKGPLAEGLVVGTTVRCPWHHSCFSLETGHADPPAIDPVACWRVERDGDRIIVREKLAPPRPAGVTAGPEPMVIVGGGAAGLSAVWTLRQEGFRGRITLISADSDPPYDRPNLSKDYLAGSAPEDWMPLREDGYYKDQSIDLILNARVSAIDTPGRCVRLNDGRAERYGALLLATGSAPVKLDVPGADLPHVHYLRSFADARAILQALSPGARVAIVGASFIGLEVAASLRAREAVVHVIAPVARPMEQVFGPAAADYIRALHESHGVVFHLKEQVASIQPRSVTLGSGSTIPADLVIVGIGVRPLVALAKEAGIALDRGVRVSEYLETNVPGIFAAGDIARWPDPHTGDHIRVEHWVVAQRQGQVAARNMLGRRERFDAVPFFWSQHYDVTISYVGHAEQWDAIEQDGSLADQNCALRFIRANRTIAVATIGRDRESLEAERDFTRSRLS